MEGGGWRVEVEGCTWYGRHSLKHAQRGEGVILQQVLQATFDNVSAEA